MKSTNQDRISGLSRNDRHVKDNHTSHESVRGFTANPLGDSVSPAQILIYQAAYQQAQKALHERECSRVECWN